MYSFGSDLFQTYPLEWLLNSFIKSKSVTANIVEGYGRKKYQNDFVKFLIYAHSSCDETISHLKMISDIHYPNKPLILLIEEYEQLGKKIFNFIKYVEKNWNKFDPDESE